MSTSLLRRTILVGILILGGVAPLDAQSFSHAISLAGLGNGGDARPFGLSYEPVHDEIYVAIAGSFANNNDAVAVIDPFSDTVLTTMTVGLFPEDIAIAYDAFGQPTLGAVSNSSDGSVSLFDPGTHTVLATVPLPDPFGFGTSYPFGVTAGGPGFYVSTVDGSGAVYAIDATTLAYDPVSSLNIGKSGGRLRADGGRLLIPSAAFTPSFTGGEGGLVVWQQTIQRDEVYAADDGNFVYPAGQDLEVLPDGRMVLGGTDFQGRLELLDPSGQLLRSLRMSGATGAQGLALSPDGTLLAVCDLAHDLVVLWDMVNLVELSENSTLAAGIGYQQPNEAVFAHGKLYVSCQANEAVLVYDNLPTVTPGPGWAGTITVGDTTPDQGATVDVTVSGPGVVALLVAYDDLPGPYQGVDLDIGPNPISIGWGTGVFQHSFTVPMNPALRGRNFFAQGIVDALLHPAPTEPRAIVVQ